MHILFVTTSYPPFEMGGWAQLVQDIRERLDERGHRTTVLCSNYNARNADDEPGVYRQLQTDAAPDGHYDVARFFTRRSRVEKENAVVFRAVVERCASQIIFFHEMWNLSRSIPWQAEQLYPEKVIYYIADEWPYGPSVHDLYWKSPTRRSWRRVPKHLVGRAATGWLAWERRQHPLRFERILCVSQARKEALIRNLHVTPDQIHVVPNGIDLKRFAPRRTSELVPETNRLSLLYAGNLSPHKGVHTAIEALNILAHEDEVPPPALTLLGAGHPDYEDQLRKQVAAYHLEGQVHFAGRVPREQMPEMLRRFDGLVFPSMVEEGLPRVMVEAMASSVVVIGTTCGGSKEILREGETGLTFAPGDVPGLARQLKRFSTEPLLRRRLSVAARQGVLERFDFERILDHLESYLQTVANGNHER